MCRTHGVRRGAYGPSGRGVAGSLDGLDEGVLRDHLNGVDGALLGAGSATGALVVVELVAVSLAQLDDGVLRAGSQAAVTLEAVAAAQAAFGLEVGLLVAQTADDLGEPDALGGIELGLVPASVVTEVPQIEVGEPCLLYTSPSPRD